MWPLQEPKKRTSRVNETSLSWFRCANFFLSHLSLLRYKTHGSNPNPATARLGHILPATEIKSDAFVKLVKNAICFNGYQKTLHGSMEQQTTSALVSETSCFNKSQGIVGSASLGLGDNILVETQQHMNTGTQRTYV